MKSDVDLLWLTNIPTPYTVPVWRELAQRCNLQVACLAASERNRSWSVDTTGLRLEILNARTLQFGHERTLYGPSWQLQRLLRHRPRTVVIDGWESAAAAQTMLTAKLHHARVIVSYWSNAATHTYQTGPIARYRAAFMRAADAIVTPGSASTAAVTAMGVDPERIFTGVASVDVQRFAGWEGERRRPNASAGRGHAFLYVGQLIERKNVDGLIRAFARLNQPDDSLSIVGEGPLRARLERLAAAMAPGRVTFRGAVDTDEMPTVYGHAETLVLPSTEEVWGLTVNECLASGLHAVVSRSCGVSATIDGMPGVFLAEPTDEELARAMRASRDTWAGPIRDHPIREHSPQAMAEVVVTAASLK